MTTYTYDLVGNLTAVEVPDGTLIEYVIDGQNRRIGKKVNGVLEKGWLYRDGLKPVAELDGAGNVLARFVYGSNPLVPDYVVKAGPTYRIVSDHLGSPRLVVHAATGAVVQRLDYDEFGQVVLDTNPGLQPFGFAGGLYDADTTLTRLGARDYDASLGRWVGKDPALLVGGGTNFYSYGESDPINFADRSGLTKTEGIKSGDDEYLKLLKETRGDRKKIEAIEKLAKAEYEAGKINPRRWKNIRTWIKLAKDGRLWGVGAVPCLTTVDCFCIQNPVDCAELLEELGLQCEE